MWARGSCGPRFKGSTFVEYELELGDGQANMLAVDGDWMSHGLHQPGDDIAWDLVPERAYALPREPDPEPTSS